MNILTTLFSCLIFIFVSVLIWIKRQYSYWEDLKVESKKPVFLLGNLRDIITQKIPFSQFTLNMYQHIKSRNLRFGGLYFLFRPVFLPVDPELIKIILVKDFDHFINRGLYFDEENDPLTAHLFSIEGNKWKKLRSKFTPTFSSGKMKIMFSAIVDCSRNLVAEMDKLSARREPVDMKDMLARFNTDVIASVAFGLDIIGVSNPDAEFHRNGSKVLSLGLIRQFFYFIMFVIPRVTKVFKMKMIPPDVSDFYFNVITNTVNYREQNNITRKDFLQLLIQLKNKGTVEESESAADNKNIEKLSFNELAAQAFVFFLAGFETSSTTQTFCLYELALNHHIQQKVRNEIEEILTKFHGELTYDAMAELRYLDKVINETLRKYPPLPILNRVCTKDYAIPNTDLIIESGMKLFIPVAGLHNDKEFYPNPQVFDPERFSEENKRKRHPYTFLPFGDGPRMCIGMRFALAQTKIGIVSLIKKYKVSVNPKTKQPLEFDPKSFILAIKGNMFLDLEKL